MSKKKILESGLWNYQILLLVHCQVQMKMVKIHLSNHDLLAWKLTIFLFLEENEVYKSKTYFN